MSKNQTQENQTKDELADEISLEKLKEQVKELENKLSEKNSELESAKKEISDWKSKASSYLNTASYYKAQAEDNKKDFDRYKERNSNIESTAAMKANQSVAKKLLPTIDNFNHAMSALPPDVMQGFIMIYSSLSEALKDLGIAEIPCKDEKLNPEMHNCLDTVSTDDESLDGIIAKVYQKGYYFSETNEVVRPANVSVYKYEN